ncbi:MAG TPA: hypothetical protein VKE51_11640, partial [Vicinamibacterales bacterium]|nr:hypothetical protein [Vicinamibacterales bacterium]
FETNVESVHQLINFDRAVMDFAIEQVSKLHDRLSHKFLNPADNGQHTLLALQNVRTNDSLRRTYRLVANQGIVLLVAYFGATVSDIFREGVNRATAPGRQPSWSDEELKLAVAELLSIRDERQSIGELLQTTKNISFQDMQSIVRAFKDYLGITPSRNTTMNNIIVAQACRNVIAHVGGRADRRLVNQIAKADPRTVKCELREGDAIEFADHEVRAVSESMRVFVDYLACDVEAAYPVESHG